jgi:DNA-binding MarR family transcriptional regulator
MPRSGIESMVQGMDAPKDILPSGLSGLLGFQLRMAHVCLYRDYAASMSALNLTQHQMAVLEIVAGTPGVSQVDIASRLSTDRGTMLAIVDRLQDRELIARKRSSEDRRRQELYLTAGGTSILQQARAVIAEHEKRFTDRFSSAELAALFEALRRLQA